MTKGKCTCTTEFLNGAPWVCPHGIMYNAEPEIEDYEAAERYADGRWGRNDQNEKDNSVRDFIAGVMWKSQHDNAKGDK